MQIKAKRRRRKVWIVVAAVLVTLAVACGALWVFWLPGAREQVHQAQAQIEFYQDIGRSERAFIAEAQLSNGALAFRPEQDGEARIVPYFSDIAARALLDEAEAYEGTVGRHIEWRLARQIQSGALYGAICDHKAQVQDGVVISESSDEDFDSVDSYAAVFIMLAQRYSKMPGGPAMLTENRDALFATLEVMLATIVQNGLSIVGDDNDTQYLMDNVEVSAALACAETLLSDVFPEEEALLSRVSEARQRMDAQIEALLWNQTEQRYEIGLNGNGTTLKFDGWEEFYPCAAAQLFPIAFGIIAPEDPRALALYSRFCEEYDWQDMDYLDNGDGSFYWGILAYTAARMGDETRVHGYMEQYAQRVLPEHEYPIYNADAAWAAMACDEMSRHYQEQIERIDPLGMVALLDSM